MSSLVRGDTPEQAPLEKIPRPKTDDVDADTGRLRHKIFHCDICGMSVKGMEQWKVHLGGKKHRGAANRKRLNAMKTLAIRWVFESELCVA